MTGIASAGVDAGECLGEFSAVDLGPSHPERLDTGLLDELEDVGARVFADHVAEETTEEPDVLAQGLGRRAAGGRRGDRRVRRRGERLGSVEVSVIAPVSRAVPSRAHHAPQHAGDGGVRTA